MTDAVSQGGPWSLSVEDRARVTPARCRKPVVGPLITGLRKAVWRLFGIQQAFDQNYRRVTALEEMLRPQVETLTRLVQTIRLQLDLEDAFQCRPGTYDWQIVKSVILGNEYQLPDAFGPDDIIVDIGTHIGAFCFAALLRGAQHVYGFEAEKENFRLAQAHLKPFGDRVRVFHKAVWRSDRTGDTLFHQGSDCYNTGGGSILFPSSGERLEVVAFDDVIRDITDNGQRRVRLLKIDCEGSEFPILLTSRTLHLIDNIRGEYHEINDGTYNPVPIPEVARVPGVERFTMAVLAECLERAGFRVRSARQGNFFLGWFFASRTGELPARLAA